MAEAIALDWDEYDAEEEITEEDQKGSNDLERQLLVGKFVCSVSDVSLKEIPAGMVGIQVTFKFRIEHVLAFETIIKDKDGKTVMRPDSSGIDQPVLKKLPVPADNQDSLNALLCGQLIFDQVKYPSDEAKDDAKGTHKRRRLFVAKKLGIIDEKATAFKRKQWLDAKDKFVIIETERNTYTAKSGEEVINHQVIFFGGYETLASAGLDPATFIGTDDEYDDI